MTFHLAPTAPTVTTPPSKQNIEATQHLSSELASVALSTLSITTRASRHGRLAFIAFAGCTEHVNRTYCVAPPTVSMPLTRCLSSSPSAPPAVVQLHARRCAAHAGSLRAGVSSLRS